MTEEKDVKGVAHTYKIKYDLTYELGDFTAAEIDAEKKGGTDAYIFFSLIREDGRLFQHHFSNNGETGGSIDQMDEFAVWLLWARALGKADGLEPWERQLALDAIQAFKRIVEADDAREAEIAERQAHVAWSKRLLPFFHPYQDWVTKINHTYKGSLQRHVVVERVIYLGKRILTRLLGEDYEDVWRGIFHVPMMFLFGWNCNFPMRDIIQYIRFWVAGTK